MNNRLLQFLNAENISQSQLADIIGVARASVSHILSGRNKPSFEFIGRMSNHFPTLNLEWLITGKGRMYKNGVNTVPIAEADTPITVDYEEDDLFAPRQEAKESVENPAQDSHGLQRENSVNKQHAHTENTPQLTAGTTLNTGTGRQVSKIIIYYSDNTFQELR